MEYTTTGSSNTVIDKARLDLSINISPSTPGTIIPAGICSVGNLDTLASGDDLPQLTCKLYGKTDDTTTIATLIAEIPYDPIDPTQRLLKFNRNYNTPFLYLIIKITAPTCTLKQPLTPLLVTFKDKNNTDEKNTPITNTLTIALQKAATPLSITSLTADFTVLQYNSHANKLRWKIDGDNYTYTLREGLDTLITGHDDENAATQFDIRNAAVGEHTYTLGIASGDSVISRDIGVRILDASQWKALVNPQGLVIGNFCATQQQDALFSLLMETNANGNAQIDSIGYTNEGFSNNWTQLPLDDMAKQTLTPFSSSPMLHLKSPGETYGRLFFIGGSHVKPMLDNNQVAIVHLDADNINIEITPECPWPSRMGHSGAIFPHGGLQEKIWIMGGIDAFGNIQNDAWVSDDGKTWYNIDKDGKTLPPDAPPATMPWSPRCMAGITVSTDKDGTREALWFGGGFSEIDGSEIPDLQVWDRRQWRPVPGVTINNGHYLSSGLGYTDQDKDRFTGINLLGGAATDNNKTGYFYQVDRAAKDYNTFSGGSPGMDAFNTPGTAVVISAYFKSCLWCMVLNNMGDEGITYSRLNYYIPAVSGSTLNIF